MKQKSSIQIFQGYDMLPPKIGKAYPVLCDEWEYLKKKIRSIPEKPNVFRQFGFIFFGASITKVIDILTGRFPNPDPNALSPRLIAWVVVAVAFLMGFICVYFAKKQSKINQMKESDVISHMDRLGIVKYLSTMQ